MLRITRVLSGVLVASSVMASAAVPASGRVVVVGLDGARTATPVTDPFAELLGWTEDGSSVVVRRGNRVLRVAVDTGRALEVEGGRDLVSLGPGGRAVFQRGVLDDTAAEVRAADGRVVATVPLGFSADEPTAAWSPDGARVAVAAGSRLAVLDSDTGAVVARVRRPEAQLLVGPQAFAPDGSALLIQDGPRLWRLDIPSGVVSRVWTGDGPDLGSAGAWSRGGAVAVTGLHAVRILGGATIRLPRGMPALEPAAWDPGGALLAVPFGRVGSVCAPRREGVQLLGADGSARTLVTPGAAEVWAVAWAPDGGRLAVAFGPRGPRVPAPRGRRHPWPAAIARDFAMFTARGDAAVRRVVLHAARSLRGGASRETTLRRVSRDLARVGRHHAEVDDTAVSEVLANQLDRWLRAAGFRPISDFGELRC